MFDVSQKIRGGGGGEENLKIFGGGKRRKNNNKNNTQIQDTLQILKHNTSLI